MLFDKDTDLQGCELCGDVVLYWQSNAHAEKCDPSVYQLLKGVLLQNYAEECHTLEGAAEQVESEARSVWAWLASFGATGELREMISELNVLQPKGYVQFRTQRVLENAVKFSEYPNR